MPNAHPPGPNPGKKFLVNVIVENKQLRYRLPDGKDATELEVRSSGAKKFKSVVWEFQIPGVTEALIEFVSTTPFFDRRNDFAFDMVRDKGKKSIAMKLKSLDWAEDDVRAIANGDRFKYSVTVATPSEKYHDDPIVIVRGNGDDGDEGGN